MVFYARKRRKNATFFVWPFKSFRDHRDFELFSGKIQKSRIGIAAPPRPSLGLSQHRRRKNLVQYPPLAGPIFERWRTTGVAVVGRRVFAPPRRSGSLQFWLIKSHNVSRGVFGEFDNFLRSGRPRQMMFTQLWRMAARHHFRCSGKSSFLAVARSLSERQGRGPGLQGRRPSSRSSCA